MWTVLIGENGTAKTSILQAIALASVGRTNLMSLARPVAAQLRDRREGAAESLSIVADFSFGPQSVRHAGAHPLFEGAGEPTLRSWVTSKKNGLTLEGVSAYVQVDNGLSDGEALGDAREDERSLWFVAGYGISRALPESHEPKMDFPSLVRLEPLMGSSARLTSTAFSTHFAVKDAADELKARGKKWGKKDKPRNRSLEFAGMIQEAIRLGGEDLLPGIKHFELRGQGGAKTTAALNEQDRFLQQMGPKPLKIPSNALSHGYQSTFAWISDLIGHVLLESETRIKTTQIEGLVLLDEIDLYLHPKWQATFIGALRRIFPKVQFVATTHSPVVLAGLAPHEVVRLIVDEKSGNVTRGGWDSETGEVVSTTEVEPVQPDPRPMTGTELYETWFGLDRLTPNPHGEALRRYLVLAADPHRNAEREAELIALATTLEAAQMTDLPKPVGGKRRRK